MLCFAALCCVLWCFAVLCHRVLPPCFTIVFCHRVLPPCFATGVLPVLSRFALFCRAVSCIAMLRTGDRRHIECWIPFLAMLCALTGTVAPVGVSRWRVRVCHRLCRVLLCASCPLCVCVLCVLCVFAYSFAACLKDLTIDHASLSRQSTVPTPTVIVETPPTLGALITFSPYIP